MEKFCKRYDTKIRGVLSCYDRVVIKGTLPGVCFADGTRHCTLKGFAFLITENMQPWL